MTAKEKMTAPIASVGADVEQPSSNKLTNQSIADLPGKGNLQATNNAENAAKSANKKNPDDLETVSMMELYDTAYPPKLPIIDGLLYNGTYLFVGSLVAVLVMCLLPNAGSFGMAVSTAMIFGLVSLMFLDTSINMAMQPFKMMVGDMVNEKQKGLAYSIQSFLCNAGSLVGFLFPFHLYMDRHQQHSSPRCSSRLGYLFLLYRSSHPYTLCNLYHSESKGNATRRIR